MNRVVLSLYPSLIYNECVRELKWVTPEGDILGGAPAFFYALSLKRFLGILRRLRRVAF